MIRSGWHIFYVATAAGVIGFAVLNPGPFNAALRGLIAAFANTVSLVTGGAR